MDEKVRSAIVRQFKKESFSKKIGLQLADVREGYAKVEMRFMSDLENMFGMAHGGAIFSLIDAAFEVASNSHGTMAVALNMNINYLASPEKGALLIAEAKEINRTKKRPPTIFARQTTRENFWRPVRRWYIDWKNRCRSCNRVVLSLQAIPRRFCSWNNFQSPLAIG